MNPINLNTLNNDELSKIMDSFDYILTDCDGVLWHHNNPIAGAAEVMNSFVGLGKKVFYITNNSTKSCEEFLEKFNNLKFPAHEDNILCTSYLVAKYLKNKNFQKKVYMIGSAGIAKELDKVGIAHVGLGKDPITSDDLSFKYFKPESDIGAVVVGFDLHFNYLKVLKAATYLNNKDVEFIATNTDEQFPGINNMIIPGTGSLVKCVETCSERKPTVMGKPSTYVSEMLSKNYQINPERTLMIGDRANTDILLGKRCNYKTLLVLTGVSTVEHLEKWKKSSDPSELELVPTYYVNSIADLLTCLKKN
ncbi:GSCOCG00003616001-RA-CDS [Cotesia congregata]|uniref:Similar to PGP: Glycerol-3-phosphate phosphatase (Bos taurus) n=1 Tax=Cotesia congregata TaxID=51543 RepID=A0A8J2MA46_COTCN|nr:GSCOCG00003616001-RA-CDS [Cotesia congregata]CAG5077967.1 Similar to PGP: Glycerol-3-phosphate phosphatase (Bos taurus) [Cotesia congregata]